MRDKVSQFEAGKTTNEKKIADLQAELENVKAETQKLKSEMSDKDATITRLENNVTLLKKELGR